MIADSITIKPIRVNEWLPDRCLNGLEPFDPKYQVRVKVVFADNLQLKRLHVFEKRNPTRGGCFN